jgi:peptide/nickel transport system ATP-binding protein/oligopeptide transport system ATP-binding protein
MTVAESAPTPPRPAAPPARTLPKLAVAGAPLLEVEDLRVHFSIDSGTVRAVDGVSFRLENGEALGIAGESGCGKTTTALSLVGLLPANGRIDEGAIRLYGIDLVPKSENALRRYRWREISIVFQGAMNALNPVQRVIDQITEPIVERLDVPPKTARKRAGDLLELVGIPRKRGGAYPHELSGGMRQRVMLAMALVNRPQVLIADEPTTALDVTIQAQILQELGELRTETGAGILLVTHDLGVVADVADRIIVMYAGRIVEQGSLDDLFYDPQHPYTWGLLGSIPRLDRDRSERLPAIPGQPPSLVSPPTGCHFRPRCPFAFDRCGETPPLRGLLPEVPAHLDRCWLEVERKRELRLVDGRIGLASETTVTS